MGVEGVAALAAAVGHGVAERGDVAQVHIRGLADGAVACPVEVAGVEVAPHALAAAIDDAFEGGVARAVAAHLVVELHMRGAAVGHGAAAVEVVHHRAAVEVHRRAVHIGTRGRGDEVARTVAGHRPEGVDVVLAVADEHIVVTAVGAAVDMLHRAATDVHARIAADAAADVVAAEEVVDARGIGAMHLDKRHALHIAPSAAAEKGVEHRDVRAVHHHMGGDARHLVAADVGEGLPGRHIAVVRAAEDGVHRPFHQPHLGHDAHVLEVVAAEDGVHRVHIAGGVVEQHRHGSFHAHTVAAAEDGVNPSAAGVDVDEDGGLQGPRNAAGGGEAEGDRLEGRVGVAVVVPGAVAGAVDSLDGRRALNLEVGIIKGVVRAVVLAPVEAFAERVGEGSIGQGVGPQGVGSSGASCIVDVAIVRTETRDVAHHVVAGEEGAVDPHIAFDALVGQAVDVALVAAAVDVAVDTATGEEQAHPAVHGALQGRHGCLHTVLENPGRGAVGIAHVGMQATGNHSAQHHAVAHIDIGGVARGHEEAHIFVVGVVALAAVGVEEFGVVIVARDVAAVVETVAAARHVAYHQDVAVEDDVGAAAGLRPDVARDVVAAVDIAEDAARGIDAAGVPDVAHAGSAVDVVAGNLRVVQCRHDGANLGGEGRAAEEVHPAAGLGSKGAGVEVEGLLQDGSVYRAAEAAHADVVLHVARVAAAVDRAHAAGVQLHHRQVLHVGRVVAREEAPYVVLAHLAFPCVGAVLHHLFALDGGGEVLGVGPDGRRVLKAYTFGRRIGGVGADVVAVVAVSVLRGRGLAVHQADGVGHRGAVAAHIGRVHHAAVEGDVGVGARHPVAAAEEVADAEVAPEAREVGVRWLVVLVDELGVEDVDIDGRGLRHRAAIVVAAEEGVDGAAVDVDGDATLGMVRVVGGDADEGVLGTAEERVDEDVVVVAVRRLAVGGDERIDETVGLRHAHGDMGRLDVWDGAVAAVAVLVSIHLLGGFVEGVVAEIDILGARHQLRLWPHKVGRVVGRVGGDVARLNGRDGAPPVHLAAEVGARGEEVGGAGHRAGDGVVVVLVVDGEAEAGGLRHEGGVVHPVGVRHRGGAVGVAEVIVAVLQGTAGAVGVAVDGAHVDAAVGVVAAAAAVDVAYVHRVVGVGVEGAQLDGGAVVALHPARDVVAAVEGVDAVGVVHRHRGVALHVGHAAAAVDTATHHGALHRLGHHHGLLVGDLQLLLEGLRGTVGVGHRDGDLHRVVAQRRGHTGEGGLGVGREAVGGEAVLLNLHIALAAVVNAVFYLAHRDVRVHLRGGRVVQRAVVEVVVGHRRHSRRAKLVGAAQVVVEVDAAAVGLLGIVDVAGGIGHRHALAAHHIVGDDGGGEGHLGVAAEGQRGRGFAHGVGEARGRGGDGQGRQAVARGDVVDGGGVHRGVHRQVKGAGARGMVQRVVGVVGGGRRHVVVVAAAVAVVAPQLARDVVVDVGGVVQQVVAVVGTVVGVVREAPTGFLRGARRTGKLARGIVEGVVDEPVVARHIRAVDGGVLLQGGAEVPVVPVGRRRQVGAHGGLDNAQARAARAHQVVAVAAPLLVVVARIARAVPGAEQCEAGGERPRNDFRVRGFSGVEGKIVVAMLGDLRHFVASQGVHGSPAVALVVGDGIAARHTAHRGVVGIALFAVEPPQVAVGQREEAAARILRPRHPRQQRQEQEQYDIF